MKKRLFAIVLVIILSLTATVYAADRQLPLLVDDAGLLSSNEQADLLLLLDEISETRQCEVAIVTVDSLGNLTATEYADDFYDYYGYGYGSNDDGILLLIDMGDRNWAISTYGFGITAFTDYAQEYLMGEVMDDLSSGNYYDAFKTFAYTCDELLIQARNGEPYDVYSDDSLPLSMIPISILIGFIIAFITVKVMASGLKSVRRQATASNYIRDNSFSLTDSHDTYLYSTVKKTKRETSSSSGGGSSTHRSSSGRSHGGSSGKF